jgi:hypothetical protein
MQTECTPAQHAAKHLKRVAALTAAIQIRSDSHWLRAGHRNFLVDHKFVRLISHHGESTCFSVAADPDMPRAEVAASASLHLKNNPRLFGNGETSLGRRSTRMGMCLETHIS